jgi:hypothetical protein
VGLLPVVVGAGPSRLLRVDLRTREATTLYKDPDGGVLRNPCVSYDGRKILVSMRKTGTASDSLTATACTVVCSPGPNPIALLAIVLPG